MQASMPPDAERTAAALKSGDAARIARALHDLRGRMKRGGAFDVEPFDAGILSGCADLPEEAQLDLVAVLNSYRRFVPPLAAGRRFAAQARVVMRYAERYVAAEVASNIRISGDPVAAIEAAMTQMASEIESFERGARGASYLVSRLIDSNDTVRGATLRMLRQWPRREPYLRVIDYVLPQLDPSEVDSLQPPS